MKLWAELATFNPRTKLYWWVVTLSGFAALGGMLPQMWQLSGLVWAQVLGLAVIVILTGLCPVRIPGTHCVITSSDIFVFLTALLFGVPAATCLAALDNFVATYRASPKWSTRLASMAINAAAMFLAVQLFSWAWSQAQWFHTDEKARLFVALLLFAFTYFLTNTFLMALYSAARQDKPMFAFWWENYAWIISTYMASATFAGLIFLGIERYGAVVILAAAPIVVVVFTTCHFYFRQAEERDNLQRQRLEAAEMQAALAEKHLVEMQESEERFRSAFDYAAIGMALVTPDGRWLQVNRSLCQLLGYAEEELLRLHFQSLLHTDDVEAAQRALTQLVTGKNSAAQLEQRFLHSMGDEVWVSLNVSVIRATETQPQRLILQMQNITDRKWAEARLLHDAFHDTLTGLPNRALFLDHLRMAIARHERHPHRHFAVLFLDFDRFKIINDSLGHLAGDELLIEIARRLVRGVRLGDTVARLGGDEFTILLEDINAQQEAIDLAERLQQSLTQSIKLSSQEVTITASIGIAFSTTGYQKPEEVLRDADTAMYQAKSRGKACYALFDPSMHSRAIHQLQIENDMRRALEREEFFLVYQPIMALETQRLVGFEALIRWQHPERGLVSPGEFIPISEETGMILPLGEWVIGEACRQMREWQGRWPALCDSSLIMSLNLSGKQLMQENIVGYVERALLQHQLDPHHLKLEITESVVMENIEVAMRKLDQLRKLGVKLSIDDFGTGYSSLSYLHRLSTDTLKIDRSFVQQMAENNENAEIVRTIITLAKNLQMDVTAEGIETVEQLEMLRALGCECGQGYLFAKPMQAEAAFQLITEQTAKKLLPAQLPAIHERAFEVRLSNHTA
jgi:diguanylate cyclase (GGDEF)-like protein/PAS domain S-box-containing protein